MPGGIFLLDPQGELIEMSESPFAAEGSGRPFPARRALALSLRHDKRLSKRDRIREGGRGSRFPYNGDDRTDLLSQSFQPKTQRSFG